MIKELTKYPDPLYNPVERVVFEALKKLPPPFKLKEAPLRIMFETDAADYCYRPDFAVECPDAKLLVIEAKSYLALTMMNLARFWDYDHYLRSEGHAYLVIVPDAGGKERLKFARPELRALPIVFADSSQIPAVVLEAAEKLSAPATIP
jgi:hypothetical protein